MVYWFPFLLLVIFPLKAASDNDEFFVNILDKEGKIFNRKEMFKEKLDNILYLRPLLSKSLNLRLPAWKSVIDYYAHRKLDLNNPKDQMIYAPVAKKISASFQKNFENLYAMYLKTNMITDEDVTEFMKKFENL